MSNSEVIRAAVLLADGFEEVEAITPIDFLRRVDIDTLMVGVTGRDVIGGHGIKVSTDISLSELEDNLDALILPGGAKGAENLSASEQVVDILRSYFDKGKLIAVICASPAVVLGKHGFLKDRDFTCYPGYEKQVSEGRHQNRRVVVDRNLITSQGPGTAAEFAMEIIRYLKGDEATGTIFKKTVQRA